MHNPSRSFYRCRHMWHSHLQHGTASILIIEFTLDDISFSDFFVSLKKRSLGRTSSLYWILNLRRYLNALHSFILELPGAKTYKITFIHYLKIACASINSFFFETLRLPYQFSIWIQNCYISSWDKYSFIGVQQSWMLGRRCIIMVAGHGSTSLELWGSDGEADFAWWWLKEGPCTFAAHLILNAKI